MSGTLTLNADAIRNANGMSHFDAGDALAREARSVYLGGLDTFSPRDDWTDEQAAYAARRETEWRVLVEKAYNDLLHRRASWVPVTVAGPSNYPAARMQKRADAEMKTGAEWSEKLSRFLTNTEKALAALIPVAVQVDAYRRGCSDPISADDPAALEKLRARLEYMQENQRFMVAANAHHRKHKTMIGFPGITEDAAAKIDASMNQPGNLYNMPYPAYALSNNNGNIARIKERIAGIEKARQRAEAEPDGGEQTAYDGFRIVIDNADNRIRFFFDEKPDERTRSIMKSNGFRWSPKAGAWQRQITGNGMYTARRVAAALAPDGPKTAPATEPEELTLSEFAARISRQ